MSEKDILTLLNKERMKLLKLKSEVLENNIEVDPQSARDEFNDGGQNLQAKNQSKSIALSIENSIVAIDAAILAVSEGKYGVCSRCGERIPKERLEIKPWSTRCVKC